MPITSIFLFMKLLKENGMDAKSDVEIIQIARVNLAAQPDYKIFVMKKYIEPALTMK